MSTQERASSDAFVAGKKDYEAGLKRSANPYTLNTELRSSWNLGWDCAQEQDDIELGEDEE